MTLITIVNKKLHNLIPIIFEFKDKIKKHILIYDVDDENIAKRLQNGILKLNERYKITQDVFLIKIDEDDKSDMLKIQNLLENEKNSLYLNAANSDITLAVIISGFVLYNGGKVIAYDLKDNSYNLITKRGFTNHTINNSMKLDDFLTILNYEIIEEQNKDKIFELKKSILYIFNDFKTLFKMRNALYHRDFSYFKSRFSNFLNHLNNLEVIKRSKILKDIGYFGNLFEKFIFLKLCQYDFDDIKVGVKINFYSKDNLFVQNEFDILAIKNNHIYTFECKLGDNLIPQDIIYKNDSLLDYFGDESRGIIINIHKEKDSKMFRDLNLLRAKLNNVAIYNEFSFIEDSFQKMVENLCSVKKRAFLLGGYDLEMKTIKKILQKREQIVFDKRLSWGAKLSDYKDKLNLDYHFFAIELIENIKPSKEIAIIDHHNNFQNKKSSLEQVCEILDVKMDRRLKLIAANDAEYIKGMQKLGATDEEIEEIRKQDRATQKVTNKDEELAIKSIENKKIYQDIVVIYSLTDKFSPIIDRVFGKNCLIYNDKKLTYYGRDIKLLTKKYENEIKNKNAYYGGNYGFFGFSEDSFSKEEIINLKNEIVEFLTKKRG